MIGATGPLAHFMRGGEPERYLIDKNGRYTDRSKRVVETAHIRSDRFRRFASRVNTVREVEILPGVSSMSQGVISAKCRLADILRSRSQLPELRDGFKIVSAPAQAIPTDTAGLRTVSAQMDPELCIRAYNRDFVSVPELNRTYASLGIDVFFHLFGVSELCGFTFRRDTSTGPFTFQREPDERVALFTRAIQNTPALADLCWAISKGAWDTARQAARALAAHDLTPTARIIRRYQVDGAKWAKRGGHYVPEPGKVREGEDWLGKAAVAEKLVKVFGRLMLLARSRGAWSMAAGLNLLLNLLISVMRLGMLRTHDRLFMPLPEHALIEYINKSGAVAASFDAKNCDQHHPPWAPVLFACLMEAAGYSAAAAWLEFILSFGPVVQTNDHVRGRGMSAFGLPDDPFTWLIQGGNKSGISTNELKNKWLNQMDQIARGIFLGHLPKEAADAFLAEIALWRDDIDYRHAAYEWSGGDNILVVGKRDIVARYTQRLLVPRASRFVFDYSQDPFVDFDGNEFVRVNGVVEFWPSVKRAFDKILSREYSWSKKAAPATGALEVVARIRRVLGGDALAASLLDELTIMLREDSEAWLHKTAAAEKTLNAGAEFSLDDLDIMDDPSKLTWKPGAAARASDQIKQRFLHSFDTAQAEKYRDTLRTQPFPSFIEMTLASMHPTDRRWFEKQLAKGINRNGQRKTISSAVNQGASQAGGIRIAA